MGLGVRCTAPAFFSILEVCQILIRLDIRSLISRLSGWADRSRKRSATRSIWHDMLKGGGLRASG